MFKYFRIAATLPGFIALLLANAAATAEMPQAGKWRRHEVSLESHAYQGNPFEIAVDAAFENVSRGTRLVLPGYYDGKDTWKIGFMPTELGVWTYTTSSEDPDLDGQTGQLNCVASGLPGLLAADPGHPKKWRFADGQHVVPIGLRCKFIQEPAEPGVIASVADFMARNRLYLINFSCTDENGYGERHDYFFEGGWTGHRFDLGIWQRLTERLNLLAERGVGVHIFLYDDDAGRPSWEGQSDTEQLVIRWLVARTCGYPIVFYNTGIDIWEYRSGADIDWIGARIESLDPYGHPRSSRGEAPNSTVSMANRTFDSWNTPTQAVMEGMLKRWEETRLPGSNDDAYGENRGTHPNKNHTPEDIRRAFWKALMAGGQGGQIRGGGDGLPLSGYFSLHHLESDLESEQWLKHVNAFVGEVLGSAFGPMEPAGTLSDRNKKQFALADPQMEHIVYWKTSEHDTHDPFAYGKMEVRLAPAKSNTRYRALWFDPRSGRSTPAGMLEGGVNTSLEPPEYPVEDWILYLQGVTD